MSEIARASARLSPERTPSASDSRVQSRRSATRRVLVRARQRDVTARRAPSRMRQDATPCGNPDVRRDRRDREADGVEQNPAAVHERDRPSLDERTGAETPDREPETDAPEEEAVTEVARAERVLRQEHLRGVDRR